MYTCIYSSNYLWYYVYVEDGVARPDALCRLLARQTCMYINI